MDFKTELKKEKKMIKLCFSGFGRVGRGTFRGNYEETDPKKKFGIALIKDIHPLDQLAYLLQHDSQ